MVELSFTLLTFKVIAKQGKKTKMIQVGMETPAWNHVSINIDIDNKYL